MRAQEAKRATKKARVCRADQHAGRVSLASGPSLPSLPDAVLEMILGYLDVTSIHRLAGTSLSYNHLIAGRTIPVLQLPFSEEFTQELATACTIEKKPVLRLVTPEVVLPPGPYRGPASTRRLPARFIAFQLTILDLSKLRELALCPELRPDQGRRDPGRRDTFIGICGGLLAELHRQDRLRCLSRLETPVESIVNLWDDETDDFVINESKLDLKSLTLYVCERMDLWHINEYVLFYMNTISLHITVLPAVRLPRHLVQLLESSKVERLEVHGPCSLQFRPRMPRLLSVTTGPSPNSLSAESCTFWRAAAGDQSLHRCGRCQVDARALWWSCPFAHSFNRVVLEPQGKLIQKKGAARHSGEVEMDMKDGSFKRWMVGIKRAFYEDYRKQGGAMDFRAWGRVRWSSRGIK